MERDPVDLFIEQWNRQRPDLDPSALGVVSRVLMLEKHLEQSADRALSRFDLSLWQFDVLAALRRSGPPFMLSPSRLMQFVTLTSGAMTNRIDRLEEDGLVERREDPDDRRGVLIALTPEGRKLVDEAIAVRLDDARRNIATLSSVEEKTLATLLRKLLIANAGGVTQSARRPKRRKAAAIGSAR
jgi:DNA-binding MarR family transcriptional regulator